MGKCGSKDGVSETSKKVSAFNKAEELTDFETFFPAGTKSELCKCLTKEIWEEYKDQSCASGVTFKKVPRAVSTSDTPSFDSNRYSVVSGPNGKISEKTKSGMNLG